jgi:hypothetical protein
MLKVGDQVVVRGRNKRGTLKAKNGRECTIEFKGEMNQHDPEIVKVDQNFVTKI